MEKFNLDRALAGEPVITRDGDEVTQIVEFKNIDSCYCVAGILNGEIGIWTIDGSTIDGLNNGNRTDLFMVPVKQSVWINVYSDEYGQIKVSQGYKLPEEAVSATQTRKWTFIKTIEITNER